MTFVSSLPFLQICLCADIKLILFGLSYLTQRNKEIKEVPEQLTYSHNKENMIMEIVDR